MSSLLINLKGEKANLCLGSGCHGGNTIAYGPEEHKSLDYHVCGQSTNESLGSNIILERKTHLYVY